MTTGKIIALTIWTFVSKVMSLLFNMLSVFVIAFLPRSKHLLISWLRSLFIVILEPNKVNSVSFHLSPSICHEVMGPDAIVLLFWILSFKPAFSLSFSPASKNSLVPLGFLPLGFPGGKCGEESACNAGDQALIPGSGRSPGEGNDNLLQHSCLENFMDRGAWWPIIHGVAKSQTWLSNFHYYYFCH